MEIQTWIGAIEAAIALLYGAIIGQRSIAQWIDDRRGQRYGVTESNPQLRMLSMQRLGAYVEYAWRDPAEAVLVTGRALGIGSALLFGVATLLLILGALTVGMVAYFTGDAVIAGVANKMQVVGGDSLMGVPLGVGLTFLAQWLLDGLANEREITQEERERAERGRAERRAAGQ